MNVGEKTAVTNIVVNRTTALQYCEAIQENHPLCTDLEAAKASGFSDLLLPVTYPSLFWQQIKIPWLNEVQFSILLSQSFHYQKRLVAHTTYKCQIKLVKLRKRSTTQWIEHLLHIYQNDEEIATSGITLQIDRT